jgi:hypothetical protein
MEFFDYSEDIILMAQLHKSCAFNQNQIGRKFMQRLIHSFVLLSLMILTAFAATPKVGEKAPQFSLPSASGATVALKDYAGKSKVVLVFYRGDW